MSYISSNSDVRKLMSKDGDSRDVPHSFILSLRTDINLGFLGGRRGTKVNKQVGEWVLAKRTF